MRSDWAETDIVRVLPMVRSTRLKRFGNDASRLLIQQSNIQSRFALNLPKGERAWPSSVRTGFLCCRNDAHSNPDDVVHLKRSAEKRHRGDTEFGLRN